jgi:hypothetical protein
MVKYQCHAASGHQTKSSIGSNAKVIKEQRVESQKRNQRQGELFVMWGRPNPMQECVH